MVSHSLVADRQRLFFDYLDSQPDVSVLQIYPDRWLTLRCAKGYAIVNNGDIYNFAFTEQAEDAVRKFKPDILYCQEELSSGCAMQCSGWAARTKAKLAYFVWENQRSERQMFTRDIADLVIAGNTEAKEPINPALELFKNKTSGR